MRMEEKDKLEGLLRLSEQLYHQYHDRTTLEWRIHVAFWALLAAAAYAVMRYPPHLGPWSLLGTLMIPIHLIWTIKIHVGNVKEQDASIQYREAAEQMIGFTLPRQSPSSRHERSQMPQWLAKSVANYLWWPSVEVGTTMILCAFVVAKAWS